MSALIWAGFALSLAALLGLARWSLWGAMAVGAAILGVFTLPLREVIPTLAAVLTDPGVLLLGLAVSVMPLIGAAMERTGRMDALVENLGVGRRAVFALAPALLGMLPMPGGALLSSPLLERTGGATAEVRAAANVWFRHAMLFVYPISASLITAAKLAGLDVWTVLPYQLPALVLSAALGYIWLLRPVSGRLDPSGPRSPAALLAPLAILLAAPALDLLLKRAAHLPVPELATLAGVTASLALAAWGKLTVWDVVHLARRGKPWRFGLIVAGMFAYLAAFQRSGMPGLISGLHLPPQVLCLGIGWLLGFATGRQQAATSIVIPIYTASYGLMGPWAFAVTYFASYLGYLLSPLHPCLTVSAAHAGTTLGATWQRLLPPSVVALLVTAVAGFVVL
ncbi:MAG: DUF401 family protein [Candidatus Acetothermia bacterium]|jgi:integral membrane protein (TIGR00529 family)|nr:DUF401 family protein [Candidatus Acetothermia bacterium]